MINKKISGFKNLALCLTIMFIVSCGGGVSKNINIKDRTSSVETFAPYDKLKNVPFEFQERDGIKVGANISYREVLNRKFYRVLLSITNNSNNTLLTKPTVEVFNNNNFTVKEIPYTDFVGFIKEATNIVIPPDVYSNSYDYYSSNSVNSPHVSFVGGFGGGFQRGFERGFNSSFDPNSFQKGYARGLKQAGTKMLSWVRTFWLKKEYTVKPITSVGGALYYTAPHPLPLMFKVNINGNEYTFYTVGTEV